MNKSLRIALLLSAAIACASLGVSSAQDTAPQAQPSTIDALELPSPAPPPGPAYPGFEEVNLAEFCRYQDDRPRYYPQRALERGVEGVVVLDCAIGDDRSLTSCSIIHEEPRRFGFADAAKRIACNFEVVERTNAGGLPAGSSTYRRDAEGEPWRARTPIRFRLGR